MPPDSPGEWGRVSKGALLAVGLLALIASFLLFFRLGSRDLDGSHEARAALNGKWFQNHGWLGLSRLPDGTLEAQKPPGYYWAVSLAASVLGLEKPDPWATRLPAALSSALVLLVLVAVTTRRECFHQGLASAFALVAMAAFVWLSRTARTDAALGGAVAVGLLALEGARGTRGWWMVCWLALSVCGFSVGWMVKGPMAVVLPAAVLVVRLALDPFNRSLRSWAIQGSLVLTLASLLVLPWYFWADQQSGGHFWTEFFGLHHVGRGLGGSRLREHPFWFYLAQLPASSLPVVLLLPLSIWAWLNRSQPETRTPSREFALLGLAWTGGALVLLSLARFKRADYLMPVFPGLALWLGFSLWEKRESWREFFCIKHPPVALSLGVFLMVLWGGCWFHWTESDTRESGQAKLARQIQQALEPQDQLVFFQVEDHLLAHHLDRAFSTQIVWASLLESASRPGGVVVVTEMERLGEGWFVDPNMMVEVIGSEGAGEGKSLVCARLRHPGMMERAEVKQNAPLRATPIAGGTAILSGDPGSSVHGAGTPNP